VRVTVIGAGGYIGSRLVPALLEAGHGVTATFTDPSRAEAFWWSDRVRVVGVDVADRTTVRRACPAGTDAVYYLVHGLAGDDFTTRDREGAYNTAHAAVRARAGRLVYLGGLVPDVPEEDLSAHLRSRLEVEQVLTDSGVPTLALRAAMVVGRGSTSFEILRQVSARLPMQVLPTWMRSRVEPVAVTDVVAALLGALDAPARSRSYDVGGGEELQYAALLRRYARIAGLSRPQVPVPGVPTGLVALIAPALTSVPGPTMRALVESLRHDMVSRERDFVRDLLPAGHMPLDLDTAIERSLAPGGQGAGDPERDALREWPTDPIWARD
jgi:uncharacterized protein YbjT (DUF2867 family)